MTWDIFGSIVGTAAGLVTIIPFAVRLFVTPVVRKQLEEMSEVLQHRFDKQDKRMARVEREVRVHRERDH